MKKITLTLLLFVGALSFSVAQSTEVSETNEKQVKTKNSVIIKDKKPAKKEVKSVRMKNLKALPNKSEEAVIEEKKTNQK
ncbi:hypothetical protein [Parvicella tangerina]|nr:hypothetical protein [Parvicella tangerina]